MKGVPVERREEEICLCQCYGRRKKKDEEEKEEEEKEDLRTKVIDDPIQAQWRFFCHNASVLLLPPPDGRQRGKELIEAKREKIRREMS